MNRYFEHQELIKRFKLLATKEIPNLRVFDATTGLFYAKRVGGGTVDYTPVKIGINGQADLYGLLKTKYGLINMQFEFKTGNAVQNKDQKTWEDFIVGMNGGYFIIRDEREGIEEIKRFMNQRNY